MEREALHHAAIKFSLDLHPSATGDVMEGVRDQLNAVLLRYSIYLGGVLVSYTQPRILSQQARIHPYFPYFHVDVLADCVLFKPAAGHILDGKVHMVSHDFIGLLVLGLFNVSIGRQHIRADLNYDAVGDCWRSQRHDNHRIKVGTALRFKVDKVDDESEFFTLAGSLLAPGTGDVAYVSQQARKKDRKRRRSEAAATDAAAGAAAVRPSAVAIAAARQPPAAAEAAKAPAAAGNVSATKSNKKAAKDAAKASANASAAAGAAVPNSSTGAGPSTAEPGDSVDVLSPRKKKRQKHQDVPTQTATPVTAALGHAPQQPPPSSGQKPAGHSHKAAANGPAAKAPAAVPCGAVANSPAPPAAARTPTADQAAANGPVVRPIGAAETESVDAQQDGKKVKQKSHKKKKREIDKPDASPSTTPLQPGQSAVVANQELPVAADSPMANGTAKKHKKHKEKKGDKQR